MGGVFDDGEGRCGLWLCFPRRPWNNSDGGGGGIDGSKTVGDVVAAALTGIGRWSPEMSGGGLVVVVEGGEAAANNCCGGCSGRNIGTATNDDDAATATAAAAADGEARNGSGDDEVAEPPTCCCCCGREGRHGEGTVVVVVDKFETEEPQFKNGAAVVYSNSITIVRCRTKRWCARPGTWSSACCAVDGVIVVVVES